MVQLETLKPLTPLGGTTYNALPEQGQLHQYQRVAFISSLWSFMTPLMTIQIHLRHVLEVDEVAEAERSQVQAGLLAAVGAFDGDGHLHVVRRPGPCIVLPLPLPALPRG